jgi:hypothetical protein
VVALVVDIDVWNQRLVNDTAKITENVEEKTYGELWP